MESPGPSGQVQDSLNQNLKTPVNALDASTEENAAIASKSITKTEKSERGRYLTSLPFQQPAHIPSTSYETLTSTSLLLIELEANSTVTVPTIVVDHFRDDEQPKTIALDTHQVVQSHTVEHDVVPVPGAFTANPAPTIPEWYTVGWRQACGIDKPPLAEGEEKDRNILDIFIGEQFYGAWYHNASIIIFVCVYHFPFPLCA